MKKHQLQPATHNILESNGNAYSYNTPTLPSLDPSSSSTQNTMHGPFPTSSKSSVSRAPKSAARLSVAAPPKNSLTSKIIAVFTPKP